QGRRAGEGGWREGGRERDVGGKQEDYRGSLVRFFRRPVRPAPVRRFRRAPARGAQVSLGPRVGSPDPGGREPCARPPVTAGSELVAPCPPNASWSPLCRPDSGWTAFSPTSPRLPGRTSKSSL